MKIGIIGNSHIASLKRAWDLAKPEAAADHPIEIVFFGHRGLELRGLQVRDGRLVPNNANLEEALRFTSSGRAYIAPEEFDAFLLYGLDTAAFFLPESAAYSKAAIRLEMRDMVNKTVAFALLKRLTSITKKPVYVGHVPLRAATGAVRVEPIPAYLAGIEAINSEIYRPIGAELLPQPTETIVNGNRTDPRFSQDSRRLAVGDGLDDQLHPAADDEHMNDAFGVLWLQQFLKKLECSVVVPAQTEAPAPGSAMPEPKRESAAAAASPPPSDRSTSMNSRRFFTNTLNRFLRETGDRSLREVGELLTAHLDRHCIAIPKPEYGDVQSALPEDYLYAAVAARFEQDLQSMQLFAGKLSGMFNSPGLQSISTERTDDTSPYWKNPYFSGGDARALYAIAATHNPALVIEVGSGNSTKFLRKAISDHNLRTRIVSIDPTPRADIGQVTDEPIASSVVGVDTTLFDRLVSDDILFIDGSHVSLPGTDVPHYVLNILPRLKSGVLVHIHDIHLPWEYAADFRARQYNEQHMVAAMLQFSNAWEIIYPVFYLWKTGRSPYRGGSLWLRRC